MLSSNNLKEEEKDNKEIICDSPKNKSRETIRYEFDRKKDHLGSGGYGDVFKVKMLKNKEPMYALKIFSKSNLFKKQDKGSRVLTEIKIHRSLNHEHICKFEHAFEDNKNVYILMEYCGAGTLEKYLEKRLKLEEFEIRYYMFQVLLVLQYLRRQKIVHRDLTLANIFLKDYKTIKIGDFGFAYKETENDEKAGVICGTRGYYAPESLTTKYSYKTDIFSFGACIYYLFGAKSLSTKSQEVFDPKGSEFQFEKKLKISKEAKDLLEKIFTVDTKRIDLEEMYVHPFFNKGKGLMKIDFPEYPENDKDEKEKKNFYDAIALLAKNENIILHDAVKEENKTYNDSDNSPNKYNISSSENSGKINTQNSNDTLSPNEYKNRQRTESNKSSHPPKNVSFNVNQLTNSKNGNKKNMVNGFRLNNGNNKKNDNNMNKNSDKNTDTFVENLRKSLVKQTEDLKTRTPMPKRLHFKNSDSSGKNSTDEIANINEFKLDSNKKLPGKNNQFEFNSTLGGGNLENYIESSKSSTVISNRKISNTNTNNSQELIYVTDVIDRMSEYCGIGYIFNDKNIGVIFNDGTQMTKIFDDDTKIIYHKKDLFGVENSISIELPPSRDLEIDTEKKVKFLGYIVEEFIKKLNLKKNFSNRDEEDIYVKKYKKNSRAHYFILSNKNVQVNYYDDIKIIFACKSPKKITYIDSNNTVTIFPLNENECFGNIECEDPEINSRIKYAIIELQK